MNLTLLNAFMSGAIVMGLVIVALLFLSFWRRSRIALLGLFGLAFFLLALEQIVLVFVDWRDEFKPFIYLIRLTAFLLIIVGIAQQNRRPE